MKPHPFNRRKFLGSAVCCAAAVGASPSGFLIAGEPAGTKRRIRIGFLGATYSHAPGKLGVILASNDFELVGVCEESAAAKQDCEKAGAKIISQDDLLAWSEVVAVESAVRDHARHALLALKAGKHVHLEKPPAMTLNEFAEMVALARERELLLQTGYMWRYNPGFTTILEAVRKGWLGKVFLVRANISNFLAPARRPDWAEFKGGSLFELGSHLVDAVVRLLGKPKSVTPFLREHGSASDKLKDNNVAVLEYAKAIAVITNNALQDTRLAQRSFEVLGSNGTAVLQPIEPPMLNIELVSAAGPYQKGTQTVPMPPYARYEADFIELAAAVRGERKLSVSLEEELAVQETLLKACAMV
jgi:predicted dehydrogenase